MGKKFGKFAAPFINRDTLHKILKQVYFDPSKITEEQISAYYLPLQMKGGKQSTLSVLKAFENEILSEQSNSFSNIQVPTLIVWGSEDRWIPVSHLENYAQDMPKAKQVILKECGHSPQEELPDQFNPILFQFIHQY